MLASNDLNDLFEWAEQEGLKSEWLLQTNETIDEVKASGLQSIDRVGLAWNWAIINELGPVDYAKMVAEGTRTTTAINPSKDYGPDRSSAHWDRWENFLTTSAMVRFMATLEQFEIDALKALFFYRPQGMGIPFEEYEEVEVDEKITSEHPEIREQTAYYKFPPLWTWIGRSAMDNAQRRQIFKRVYDIQFPQPKFGKKHADLCEMRNAIAHGRQRVDITLMELIEIHCYVTKAMLAVRDTIRTQYRLIL